MKRLEGSLARDKTDPGLELFKTEMERTFKGDRSEITDRLDFAVLKPLLAKAPGKDRLEELSALFSSLRRPAHLILILLLTEDRANFGHSDQPVYEV